MFIRIKKIQNKEYAYLVKNIWRKRKKSSRQKVSKYLGKVQKINKIKNFKLQEHLKLENLKDYLEKTSNKKIIKELIRLELLNHNFKQKSKNIFFSGNIKINLTDKTVKDIKIKKDLCLEINNNFLCSYTLSRLIEFNPKKGLTELQVGKQLANTFESTGILVPKEIFVIIAKKILEEIKKDSYKYH